MGDVTYQKMASFLAAHDQIALFLTLIAILIVGGFVLGQLTRTSPSPNSQKMRAFKKRSGVFDGRHLGRSQISQIDVERRLVLDPLLGDKFGFVGEQIYNLMKSGYGRTGYRHSAKFSIVTGLNAHRRLEKSQETSEDIFEPDSKPQPYDVTIEGEVSGLGIQLKFFPQGPYYNHELIDELQGQFPVNSSVHCASMDYLRQEQDEGQGSSFGYSDQPDYGAGFQDQRALSRIEKKPHQLLSYECCDFPLFEIKGLTSGFHGVQKVLLLATMAGLMSRGCGISGQLVDGKTLLSYGKELDKSLKGIRLTQDRLYQEMLVVTAWCYFVAGLLSLKSAPLKRALELYELVDESFWHDRELTEWAGIKSNYSMAALTLALIEEEKELGAPDQYYKIVQRTAHAAMRSFRRDNFPHNWGKLMCKLALAQGALDDGAGQFKEYGSIEQGLDQAIEYWRSQGQEDAICEAYYAKGKLAQTTAKRHMGVQDWERAENAFLAALALSTEDRFGIVHRRPVIRFELGSLYLGWGTRFGEAELLEKAIHQFTVLLDNRPLVSHKIFDEAQHALAMCYLNFGGITNKTGHLKLAIHHYNNLLDQKQGPQRSTEIQRALCVAHARLALKQRDRAALKRAITAISSVIGQKKQLWPSRDVLLRLRARLREMLFTLEGDDVALDRAIKDRRELVAAASEGLMDLRWAVEVGDLVGLLSRRQYKLDGQMQDFNEAHYLLEKAIGICENTTSEQQVGRRRFDIPHIKASLHLKLAKLLATFARVQFDEQALREAIISFEQYIKLCPRSLNPTGRAHALNDIGQIMMDLSEHYGHHDGLQRAVYCFSEAHDIYLEAGYNDLSNRMRRFLENAEAAMLAYDVPVEQNISRELPLKLSLFRY